MLKNRNNEYINKFLSMSKQKDRLLHSYLFVGEKGSEKMKTAKYLAKLILCKDNACDSCNICKRIDENNHTNIEIIKPIDNTIKKEQIISLQEKFSKKALEEGAKIYIIENAEKMNVNSSNSLLKFLEEPTGDIYGILLTDNMDKILSTIISRSQVLVIPSSNSIKEKLITLDIDEASLTVLPLITSNEKEAIEVYENQSKQNIIKSSIEIIKRMGTPRLVMQSIVFHNLTREEQRDYYKVILKFMMDVLYTKMNKEALHFKDYYNDVNRVSNLYSQASIMKIINILIECDFLLNYNVNESLFLNKTMIQIERVPYESN